MKECSKCLEWKELEEYNKDKNMKDWHMNMCRACDRERKMKYHYKNRDKILEKKKKYYSENKEKIAEYNKEYSRNNLEMKRLHNAKRRALKQSTSDWTITIEATQKLLDEQWGCCTMCGLDITDRSTRHLDHVHPLSKWGLHSITNVQWLCAWCNLKKWDKLDCKYNLDG